MLSAVIAVIIVVSLFQLISIVFTLLVPMPSIPRPQGIPERVRYDHDALDRDGVPAFHRARGAASGQHHPVKTVVLIALIALSRKFVVLDSDARPGKDSRAGAPRWLWVRPTGCCASAATAPLETSEHDPSSSQ